MTFGPCDGCRSWTHSLRDRQDGLIHRRLCPACYPLLPGRLPVNLDRWDGPSPLLVAMLLASLIVSLAAWMWSMLL